MSDDTSLLQSAINAAVGSVVRLPSGTYRTTAPLVLPAHTRIEGAGMYATTINVDHAGDGLQSTHPINSSTNADLMISNLGIVTTHANQEGAGFVDVGGSFIHLHRCLIQGFKRQVILDQSELVILSENTLYGDGPCCVWLVNGPDHTPNAGQAYTNRITIRENQIDSYPGISIVDDGGMSHVIERNNFNDGSIALRAHAVMGLIFRGNEVEMHRDTNVRLAATTLAGVSHYPCQNPIIDGNFLMLSNMNPPDLPAHCVDVEAAVGGSITNNTLGWYYTSGIRITRPATSGMAIFGNAKLPWGSGVDLPTYSVEGGDLSGFLLSQAQ